MSYLPGVPDMGPAPVSPTISTHTSVGKGGPQGIAAVASGVGKASRTQHLGSLIGRAGAGSTAAGGGNPLAHSIGHYGKTPPATPLLGGSAGMAGGVDPTAHAGAVMIRGGKGQMRSHIREGGLGAGQMGMPGSANTSMDAE